jgi:phosphomannomutase
MFNPALFQRSADVRGVYPNDINEELAWFTGRYLARHLREVAGDRSPTVLVGRDGRTSSPAIYKSVIEGLISEQARVVPCGLATTDMIQWGAGERLDGAIAGAMITASHNPPEYNGIKMVLRNSKTEGLDIISPRTDLLPYYNSDSSSGLATPGGALTYPGGGRFNLHRRFVEAACAQAPLLASAKGKIVFDPGNGVGGIFIPLLREQFQRIGAQVELITVAEAIDGRFPTRPSNPGLPGAVQLLQKTVVEHRAAFGVALDGDADRAFLVDEQGTFIPGSNLLAALADAKVRSALKNGRAEAPVVFAAVASFMVIDAIRAAGGVPLLCRVGQDAAKVALMQTGAVFGGESSAHYNFPESYGLDSGLFALMAFWNLLLESGATCSGYLHKLPTWPASGEINLRIVCGDWKGMSGKIIAAIESRYRDPAANCYVATLDGVTVYHPRDSKFADADALLKKHPADPSGATYRIVQNGYRPDWWFNVRASNNEPLLRVNLEAADASQLTSRTLALIASVKEICHSHGAGVEIDSPGNLSRAALEGK